MNKDKSNNVDIKHNSNNKFNKETIEAMLEAERIAEDSSVKEYNDVDELFVDLLKR